MVLPLEFDLPGGDVLIPTGWIPGELVQTPTDGGTCGEPGTTSVYLNRGSGIFEFSIPASVSNPPARENSPVLMERFWSITTFARNCNS